MTGSTPSTSTARRRGVRALGLLVVLGLGTLLTACDANTVINRINDERVAAGVPRLDMHAALMQKAQAWSEQMAKNQRISHSVLTDGVPGAWKNIGENVACDDSLEGALQTLRDSSGHYANMINRSFTHIGAGVAYGGPCIVNGTPIPNAVFVTEVFVQY